MDDQAKKLGYTQDEYVKYRKYAKRALFFFSLLYLFFYNARQNINSALPLMQEAFGVGATETGVVTSALFWCYGFGHLFSGRLSEMFGIKRFIVTGVIISVVCNFLISLQNNLTIIAILWGLNGFAQSMVWSPGFGMLAQWYPKKGRGKSTALATSSATLAQIVTMVSMLIAFQVQGEKWQACFQLPLIPIVFVLIVFIVMVKNKPTDVGLKPFYEENNDAAELEKARKEVVKAHGWWYPYKVLLSEPKMIMFMLIIAIGGLGRYGLLTWIPNYFKNYMGMNIKSGIVKSILLPVGQSCAHLLLPILSDKVFHGKREPLLIIHSIVAAVLLCVFPFLKTATAAQIMLLFVGFFASTNSLVWAFASDIGTRELAGTASGMLDWASYMGAAIQAILFGWVQDVTGNPAYVFVTIGILYLVMCFLAITARKMKVRGAEIK